MTSLGRHHTDDGSPPWTEPKRALMESVFPVHQCRSVSKTALPNLPSLLRMQDLVSNSASVPLTAVLLAVEPMVIARSLVASTCERMHM